MPAYSGNRIDPNLTPSNIKDGVSIFGVDGTLVSGSGSSFGGSADEIFTTPTKNIFIWNVLTQSSIVTGCFDDVNYIYFCGVVQAANTSSCGGALCVVRFEKSTGNKDVYRSSFGTGTQGVNVIGVNGDDIIFRLIPGTNWTRFSTTSLEFYGAMSYSLPRGVEQAYSGFNTFSESFIVLPGSWQFPYSAPSVTNITGGTVVFNGDTYSCRGIVTRMGTGYPGSYTIRFTIVKS